MIIYGNALLSLLSMLYYYIFLMWINYFISMAYGVFGEWKYLR